MKTTIPLVIFVLMAINNSFSQNSTIKTWPIKETLLHKKEVIHNNYDLDNTINLKDADTPPIFQGCSDRRTNQERVNCLVTNLTIQTTNKFIASNVIKKSKLRRGTNRMRIMFLVDENGQIKLEKILGNWSKIIYNEIKKSIESAPKLIPGKLSNQNIPVKYSIKIQFVV